MLFPENARRLVGSLVDRSIGAGATAADALYVGDRSSGVQVRLGEIESVSRSEGEEVGLRIFVGHQSATVASSDLSDEALGILVERCLAMAREAPEDAFAGLAPAELLEMGELPNLDGNDPREPDPSDLRARALETEQAALAVEGVTNSSGAGASASASTIALATSGGFSGAYQSSGHGCSAAVIAGEAIVPRLVLNPTCVGAATTLPTPSRSVAVTLPVAPQAIDGLNDCRTKFAEAQ